MSYKCPPLVRCPPQPMSLAVRHELQRRNYHTKICSAPGAALHRNWKCKKFVTNKLLPVYSNLLNGSTVLSSKNWTINRKMLLSKKYKIGLAKTWTINQIKTLSGDPLNGFDCIFKGGLIFHTCAHLRCAQPLGPAGFPNEDEVASACKTRSEVHQRCLLRWIRPQWILLKYHSFDGWWQNIHSTELKCEDRLH